MGVEFIRLSVNGVWFGVGFRVQGQEREGLGCSKETTIRVMTMGIYQSTVREGGHGKRNSITKLSEQPQPTS
jgi:hypothetical protein